MTTLTNILRNIISNKKSYCCLCFRIIEGEEAFFNLRDEVMLDEGNAKKLRRIFSSVLGEQVIKALSTDAICQSCTETAIKSYKFIELCHENVLNLLKNIDGLQNYTETMTEDQGCKRTLFLILNPKTHAVNYIYDKKRHLHNKTVLIKKLQHLKRKAQNTYNYISIDINYEGDDNTVDSVINETTMQNQSVWTVSKDSLYEMDDDCNYKCKQCIKVFETILKLREHYKRSHAPKDYQCSKCPRSYGSLHLLKRHNKESHCMVVCSQCGKIYRNVYSLRHHERSHKLQFVCQTCGKVYKGKQAFNNHTDQNMCHKMRKSNTEAKFICDYCDKKYSQKSALYSHIRVQHENGKALECDWCGKKISSISRLKEHILKHTKEKKFVCNICDGQFVSKTSLLYHTRTHTGEKPYKCEFCNERFLSRSRRTEHVKCHHSGPDLECHLCHKKFKGQRALKRHQKLHFNSSSKLNITLLSQKDDN